jgi:hypothetical protein
MEQLEFRHRKSMAAFPPEGKKESPGIYLLSGAAEPESYPLKNAMSPNYQPCNNAIWHDLPPLGAWRPPRLNHRA